MQLESFNVELNYCRAERTNHGACGSLVACWLLFHPFIFTISSDKITAAWCLSEKRRRFHMPVCEKLLGDKLEVLVWWCLFLTLCWSLSQGKEQKTKLEQNPVFSVVFIVVGGAELCAVTDFGPWILIHCRLNQITALCCGLQGPKHQAPPGLHHRNGSLHKHINSDLSLQAFHCPDSKSFCLI